MYAYIIVAIALIAYFELLGKALVSKLKLNGYIFGFEWGYIAYTALTLVTTGFLGLFCCKTIIVFLIYILLLLAGAILIVYERKSINLNKNKLQWLLLIILNVILCYFSYKTTFGNMYGFDTESYTGLVSVTGISETLNSIAVSAGIRMKNVSIQYCLQTYYYFASFIQTIALKIFGLINIEISRLSLFTWVFQIIFNHFFLVLILETLNKYTKGKHLFNVTVLFFLVFFYGKLYFNNVFGFYGNSFRTIVFAYLTLVTLDYFKNHGKIDKAMIGLCILSACSFSSSAFFISMFYIYGLFFATIQYDDDFFRFISLAMFIPIFALLAYISGNINLSLVVAIILCIMLFILNKKLVAIFRKKYVKIGLLLLITISTFVLSYTVTKNIFDFSAFLNNRSLSGDMMLVYTKPGLKTLSEIYVLIAEISLLIYLIKNGKNEFTIMVFALVISFFNPFCCAIINKIDIVYYRSYEIFLNPCTWIITLASSLELIKNKYLINATCIALICVFLIKTNILKPIYYHYSFIPTEDYNSALRMTDDEYDVIKYIENDFKYRNIDIPFIASNNLLTESLIPEGRYVFTRESENAWFLDENCKMIFKIFYPVEYYRDYVNDGIDIKEVNTYIENSGIDYLVVDKSLSYFNEENNDYEYLYMKVLELHYDDVYENDNFMVFYYCRAN